MRCAWACSIVTPGFNLPAKLNQLTWSLVRSFGSSSKSTRCGKASQMSVWIPRNKPE